MNCISYVNEFIYVLSNLKIIKMDKKSYEHFFVNFANKKKFEIMLALKEKPMNVSEIVKKVGGEQSAISHNLKGLAECRIIEAKKSGKERVYSLNKHTIIPMLKLVKKHVHKNCPFKCWKNCPGRREAK